MKRLLVVHHSPTPVLVDCLEAVCAGIEAVDGVNVDVGEALSATTAEAAEADGVVLGTPANFGYMSGALKHFFDQTFEVLEKQPGKPYAVYVRGRSDTEGARRSITVIADALGWHLVQPPLELVGDDEIRGGATPGLTQHEALWELGAATAAHLTL